MGIGRWRGRLERLLCQFNYYANLVGQPTTEHTLSAHMSVPDIHVAFHLDRPNRTGSGRF